jgi:hypothetical protein
MIPVAGAVRVGDCRVHGFRLSIPFLLLWILLAPVFVLLVPVIFIACICVRVDPFRAIGAIFQILAALRGTHVEVVNDNVSVLVNIF